MADQAEQLRRAMNAEKNSASRSMQTVVVASGKGGVGKTSIAANVAVAMAQLGKRVGILDADLGLANIDILFRVGAKYTLKHVITGEKHIEEIMVEGPLGVSLIPSSSGVQALTNLPSQAHKRLISELNRLNGLLDILVIDTAAGIGNDVLSFALAADQILTVTTPDPMAYTDAYALIKVIARRRKNARINLVVNMVRSAGQGREVADILQSVVKKFNVAVSDISYLAYVPNDAKIRNALIARGAFILESPNTRSTKCIQVLAKKLIYLLNKDGSSGEFSGRLGNELQ